MRCTGKPWPRLCLTAMAAAFATGCGKQPQESDARPLPFDTRPAEPNEVPYAEGVGGALGYRNGCLFVSSPGGGVTGLVMPDSFELKEGILSNGHASFRLGEWVNFSAGFASPEYTRELACRAYPVAIVVNSFSSEPPPQPFPEEEQD